MDSVDGQKAAAKRVADKYIRADGSAPGTVPLGESVSELLSIAADAVASGDRSFRVAAENIGKAQEQGASQRQIARAIGKSVGWVNRLLAWRREGCIGDAFGGQRKRRVQAPEQQPDSATQGEPPLTPDEEKVRAGAEEYRSSLGPEERDEFDSKLFGRSETPARMFDDVLRRRLVSLLGMMGSAHDGEIANAARMVEKQRVEMDLTWDDLIIDAQDIAFNLAA